MTSSLSLKQKTLGLLGAAAVFVSFTTTPAQAAEQFSADQKTEIEQMFKDYIMNNGEVVIEAVDAFRQKEEVAEQEKMAETIQSKMSVLASADAPSAGNPKGDVTIIEFLDYNCGYCKKAWPDINTVLETDKNVHFIFREMPILGESSKVAAQWALAAQKQDKYFEFHSALMKFKGAKNEKTMLDISKKLGLDTDKMKKDANSKAIKKQLDADIALARSLGVSGTPAFIIGGEFYPGYLGKEGFKDAIKKARDKKDG